MNGENPTTGGGIDLGQVNISVGGAIAAITAINPVLGGIAAAIVGLLKLFGLRGPTVHADQRQAEQVTLESAVKLTEKYQQWFGVQEVDRIAQRLADRFRDHVQSRLSTPLSEFNPRIKDWDRQFARRTAQEITFFHVNWAALIWSFRAIDAEHPEQFEEYYSPFRQILAEETKKAVDEGLLVPSASSPFRQQSGGGGGDVGEAIAGGGGGALGLAAAAGALWFILKR